MQIEKELMSLDPLSFERIDAYMAYVKNILFKMGECGKEFLKQDVKLFKLIPMSIKTLYDVLYLMFHANWVFKKEDNKNYTFDSFHGLLIGAHEKFLDEGKPNFKQQDHLLKGKG